MVLGIFLQVLAEKDHITWGSTTVLGRGFMAYFPLSWVLSTPRCRSRKNRFQKSRDSLSKGFRAFLAIAQQSAKRPLHNICHDLDSAQQLSHPGRFWKSPPRWIASRKRGQLQQLSSQRPKNPPKTLWRNTHVFLNRVQQTVSGNKPSQYPPDTIHWTLFRCSLRG